MLPAKSTLLLASYTFPDYVASSESKCLRSRSHTLTDGKELVESCGRKVGVVLPYILNLTKLDGQRDHVIEFS